MITAKEFLKSKGCEFNTYDIGKCFDGVEIKDVIEFAKLHVEENNKKIIDHIKELYEFNLHTDILINEDDILNPYPLENIK